MAAHGSPHFYGCFFWCVLYVTLTRGSWTDAQWEADSIREQECRAFRDDHSHCAARFICLSMGPDYAWTEMARRDQKGQ